MATVQLLQSIKESSNKDLFIVKFSEEVEIVFHLLSVKQAFQISKVLGINTDPNLEYYIYKYIFDECVTDNCIAKLNDSLPAGIESSIAQTILFLSGVSENAYDYTEQLIDLYRDSINGSLLVMKRVICQVFSGYTFDKLDELNYQELIEVFACAEQTLIDRGIIESRITFSRIGEEAPQEPIEQIIQRDMQDYKEFENTKAKQKIDINKLERIRQQRAQQIRGG